jgi:DNA (cytosine-5)-methyltransferase 1
MRTLLSRIEDYPAHFEACWQEHLRPKGADAPTVISLFAGCGGSSLGYSMVGFRELLAVEWDDNAVETFKLNFPGVPVWQGDIAELSVEECPRITGLKPGELDVLDGSSPCQGFSTAGKRRMKVIFAEILRELKASGYHVSARLMNAMFFGVPQSRERMIFVGGRQERWNSSEASGCG